MDYQLVPEIGLPVIECLSGVTASRDAMELVFACSDANTDLLLINGTSLPGDFFKLRTGFAGEFVQRLANIRLRTAAVFAPEIIYPKRFNEFLHEARRNPQFRAFDRRSDALRWLLSTQAA